MLKRGGEIHMHTCLHKDICVHIYIYIYILDVPMGAKAPIFSDALLRKVCPLIRAFDKINLQVRVMQPRVSQIVLYSMGAKAPIFSDPLLRQTCPLIRAFCKMSLQVRVVKQRVSQMILY